MSSSISAFLCPFVALLYPAYASYKAVETPEPEDDTQWLTYWIIVAMFQVAEIFTDALLRWMPMYFEFKLVVLILLQNTTLRIPCFIYKTFVKPALQPNEPAIDEWLSRSYLHMITGIVNGMQYLVNNGPTIMLTINNAMKAAAESAQKTAAEEHQRKLQRKESSQPPSQAPEQPPALKTE